MIRYAILAALALSHKASGGAAGGAAAYIIATQTEALGTSLIMLLGAVFALVFVLLAIAWICK